MIKALFLGLADSWAISQRNIDDDTEIKRLQIAMIYVSSFFDFRFYYWNPHLDSFECWTLNIHNIEQNSHKKKKWKNLVTMGTDRMNLLICVSVIIIIIIGFISIFYLLKWCFISIWTHEQWTMSCSADKTIDDRKFCFPIKSANI